MWCESLVPISLASLAVVALWRGPNFILYHLKFGLYTLTVTTGCAVALPFYLVHGRSHDSPQILGAIVNKICEWTLSMRWALSSGEEQRLKELAKEGAVVVVNHQSCLDLLGVLHIWSTFGKLGIISKREILFLGPIGLLSYLLGVTFIDRRKSSEAMSTLSKAAADLKSDGVPLLVFPEGTRHHCQANPDLLPFKRGAFLAAIEAKVPIIPVVFSHYGNIDHDKKLFLPGRCKIDILDTVSTDGLSEDDVPYLIETTRVRMRNVFLKNLLRSPSLPEN